MEFREWAKIPKRRPTEHKGPLSKGLREVTGHPAVHLSSINGVTEDRALPLRATVLPRVLLSSLSTP